MATAPHGPGPSNGALPGSHARLDPLDWAQGEQFYLHDRVMVTENDYEADVRNGDLGTITEVFDGPDGHGAGAAMDVEGRRIPLIVDVLSSLPRLRRDRTQSPG